jgi:ubiquinone/menaquinone biosynthesis C-methylase UbiE
MAKAQSIAEQYKGPSNLEARIALHARFSTNKYGLHRWVFDQFELPGPASILELGCGVGSLWLENQDRIPQQWDVTLSDFSAGMLDKARENLASCDHAFAFRIVDAVQIPYPSRQFDAVIANHMLYYVEPKDVGFSEICRVLKPGGSLYATTVGEGHMRELLELTEKFEFSLSEDDSVVLSFTLENAVDQIAEWFAGVELRRYQDSLIVTDEGALLDYVLSFSMVQNLPEDRKADLVKFVRQRFAGQGGVFSITKDSGMVLARRV